MAEQQPTPEREPRDGARVPVMQEIYDNIWFLFLVSGVIILVSYIIWALIDLINVPTLR
ncbi:MAG: hypothetical protein HY534_03640 [Chloroflexi bacterium]|nr:hypothetical protein [Chloroflexota bacterium]